MTTFNQGGGHGHVQLGRKLVEPPGACRSNHEVLQGLARRLGAEHAGFRMTALEVADATLRASGYEGVEALRAARWFDRQPSFRDSHFLNGFGHPDGRFRFAPDWAAIGRGHAAMPRLPDHMTLFDQASDACPFRLVTAPARQFLNTSFTETPTARRREGRPTALLHAADAARLGVARATASGWAMPGARWSCMWRSAPGSSRGRSSWRASGRTPPSRAASASMR
ncbi:MAG: hypothetical protein WDN49_15820 [Acetobacteraceae bacterium]